MATVLVATASVHTTAAICDVLADRLDPSDDVVGLSVREPGLVERDAEDALNVLRTRLPGVEVRTVVGEGEPASVILETATEESVDAIVVGNRHGDPAADVGTAPGSTVTTLLSGAETPVVVVPVTPP